jgi:hypothetical protein
VRGKGVQLGLGVKSSKARQEHSPQPPRLPTPAHKPRNTRHRLNSRVLLPCSQCRVDKQVHAVGLFMSRCCWPQEANPPHALLCARPPARQLITCNEWHVRCRAALAAAADATGRRGTCAAAISPSRRRATPAPAAVAPAAALLAAAAPLPSPAAQSLARRAFGAAQRTPSLLLYAGTLHQTAPLPLVPLAVLRPLSTHARRSTSRSTYHSDSARCACASSAELLVAALCWHPSLLLVCSLSASRARRYASVQQEGGGRIDSLRSESAR